MQFYFTEFVDDIDIPVLIEASSKEEAIARAEALGDHCEYLEVADAFWLEDYKYEVPIYTITSEPWRNGPSAGQRGIIVHYDDGTSRGFIR